jgi:hypothetical protein
MALKGVGREGDEEDVEERETGGGEERETWNRGREGERET